MRGDVRRALALQYENRSPTGRAEISTRIAGCGLYKDRIALERERGKDPQPLFRLLLTRYRRMSDHTATARMASNNAPPSNADFRREAVRQEKRLTGFRNSPFRLAPQPERWTSQQPGPEPTVQSRRFCARPCGASFEAT